MKIVFLDTLTLGNDIDLTPFEKFGEVIKYQTTTPNETLQRVQNSDIIITNKVVIDRYIMDNSNIKLICVTATGTNNIDMEYAKEKGIEVKNAIGYSTSSVAQVTISLVLEFVQKLNYYKKYVKENLWEKSPIFTHIDVPFYELENKNWGIIGLGNIGEKVANIAKSFGCNVSYYSTSGMNNNTNYNNISLEELLKTSDIITIHCGLNNMTSNLLNKTNLNLLKDNAILINVGRGGIINEDDLVDIFNKKPLYIGLDVVEKEPIQTNSILKTILNNERVIITPHIAWASVEARNRLIIQTIKNIENFVI